MRLAPPPQDVLNRLTSGNKKAWEHESVRDWLLRVFHKKCAYCESKVYTADREHFRPREFFPELANDWKNLRLSCKDCHQPKNRMNGTHRGMAARFVDYREPLDPCGDEFWTRKQIRPVLFPDKGKYGYVHLVGLTPEACETIAPCGLDLNRTMLQERRAAYWNSYRLLERELRDLADLETTPGWVSTPEHRRKKAAKLRQFRGRCHTYSDYVAIFRLLVRERRGATPSAG